MQPIPDEKALVHKDLLVVADLHIGFEVELSKAGIRVPTQTPVKLKKLVELVKKTKCKRLLILGDLRHKIPLPTVTEELEVREFISQLRKVVHVEIVKGNHDGNLEFLEVPIYPPSGVPFGDVGFFHGNAWPDEKLLDCKYLIMGHTHPVIVFEDKLGYRSRLPCWLRVKFNPEKSKKKFGKEIRGELVVMPAFNELAGGIAVNTDEKLVGPIFKLVELDQAEVYLLDGTNLGRLEDLRIEHKKAFNSRKRGKA